MINLLNEGFIRLVAYMQPVPQEVREFDSLEARYGDVIGYKRDAGWTGDLEIVRNARVSFDADWRVDGTLEHEKHCLAALPPMSDGTPRKCNCTPRQVSDSKLIEFLWKNRHTSPFEAMVFTFEVKAPIFVFRQWHRHRTWSYNELSGRYGELSREYWGPQPDEIGFQNPHNKQGRILRDPFEGMTAPERIAEEDRQNRISESFYIEAEHAFERYSARLGEGVPREVARVNLPLSTYSRMFSTVDLLNLFHFITLRDSPHAQREIQVYAAAMKELVRPIVPYAVAAFERYQLRMVDLIPAQDYVENNAVATVPPGA